MAMIGSPGAAGASEHSASQLGQLGSWADAKTGRSGCRLGSLPMLGMVAWIPQAFEDQRRRLKSPPPYADEVHRPDVVDVVLARLHLRRIKLPKPGFDPLTLSACKSWNCRAKGS